MSQFGFFDHGHRLKSLSDFGDPLERLSRVINFEVFREPLEKTFAFKSSKRQGGRPPYDGVLIFKILVLQSLYTLSDDQMEYQIKDRLSFMRFLNLSLSDRVPDGKTIWLYRERLKENGLMDRLFRIFDQYLKEGRLFSDGGSVGGCEHYQSAPSTDDRRRETPSQIGRDSRGLERASCKAVPERSGCQVVCKTQ